MENSKTNTISSPFNNPQTPFGSMPFQQIKTEDYLPALKNAITLAKTNVEKIKQNPQPANFANTIVALETSSEDLENIESVYLSLFSAEANNELQDLAKTILPMLSEYSSDLLMDAELFKRIKFVYENELANLNTTEEKQLLTKSYKDFVRNGALLDNTQKETLKNIDQELSVLNPKFAENILKANNAYTLHLNKKEELVGLPESAIEAASITAKEKNLDGWAFTLNAPSFIPFLTYSQNRPAREKLWLAINTAASTGETDNRETLLKTVKLRHRRANTLGYETHANFILEERMAENPTTVHKFLNHLLESSKTTALKEVSEVKDFKTSYCKEQNIEDHELMPWDFAFYSEKLKEKKFNLNFEELRPYFKLDNVISGSFEHAKKLYNLNFKENTEIETYHSDVKVYEIYHNDTNDFIGLFYTDFFPRKTKKNGAWATSYQSQGLRNGKVERPHVSIVCNFTKPTTDKPSLLTFDEVRTLFHEFGHALHGLLAQSTYCSISGMNVFWDFVELPSQINENWVLEKETLSLFAKHYETNELIPDELIEKIKSSSTFMAGYSCMRQLSLALLDMAWHDKDPSAITDVKAFEKSVTEKTALLPTIDSALTSTKFSHIFAGGYSSAYYSYKWAEVLDADAFEFFKEKGIYNQEAADSFRENILERGGTEHPMELYKKFRGREPDPNALLRRDNLI